MKRLLATLCIAVAFTLPHFVTYKYVCLTDENWPDFYGFPFIQSTDRTWIFSMSGNLYAKGFIGNVLFWSIFIYGLVYFLDTIKHKFFRVFGKIVIVALCVMSVVVISFEAFVFDWRLEWDHDNFKMNYYIQDLDCEKTFKFFE
ncbi:hypothetical protein [Olleya namhaensis]|uniref:hypothetical protein n=1 Tax=Olleya namhaensis TaxID=1144750 RepID=UPI00249398F2|nr:hypothetical protein [Olleya namhaensis]